MIPRDFVRIEVPHAELFGNPFASRRAGFTQQRQFTAFDLVGFKDELNPRAARSNLTVAIASINAPPFFIVGIATPRSTSPMAIRSRLGKVPSP
jgi:hypothetical protein